MRETLWRLLAGRPIVVGFVIAVLYWVFDAIIEAFLFREGEFRQLLLEPSLPETYFRLLLILIISVFATALGRSRQAEQSLRASEQRFRSLVEAATSVIVVLTPDHTIAEFNPEAERLYGVERSAVLGKDYFELFLPPDVRSAVAADMDKVLAGEPTRGFENAVVRADGAERILLWHVSRLVDDNGRPTGVVAIGLDVTEERLAASERVRGRQLSDALNDINAAITSTLDINQIMGRVVVSGSEAMGAETAIILMAEDADWVVRYTHGLAPETVGTRFAPDEATATTLAVQHNAPVAVEDAYNDPRVDAAIVEKYGIRSLLAIPLSVRGRAVGGLLFQFHTKAVKFTEAEIDFSRKLAAAIALALENARLYGEEKNIANTLQKSLLTVPEQIEGVEFGYLYRSATEAAQVGGDFYDVFQLEHNRVGIVVGDVSGKGLQAATVTSLARNTIKAYAYQGDSPGAVMAKTNRVALAGLGPAAFVTVFLGLLDTQSGVLTFCSAGHPPPIVRRLTSEVTILPTTSPALGILAGLEYRDSAVRLEPGDILLLYTDGVTEARRDDQFFGEAGLVAFLQSLDTQPARAVPDLIMRSLVEFTGGNLADDVALLALSRLA